MTQVSRPMQILLAVVLVFAVAWFAVLRPKAGAEDAAATPTVTPVPAAAAGGEKATTGLGKTIETARNGAAKADASAKSREQETGEESATTPRATKSPRATQAAAAPTSVAKATPAAKAKSSSKAKADDDGEDRSPVQRRADHVIEKVKADLSKRRAVVVLVWSSKGSEDKIIHKRITREINRRGGRVRVYVVPVGEVGRYDGLLGGLSLGQTPSTIVIAPNNEAKVLGGLVSTARLDRLTSSATLTKPVSTTP